MCTQSTVKVTFIYRSRLCLCYLINNNYSDINQTHKQNKHKPETASSSAPGDPSFPPSYLSAHLNHHLENSRGQQSTPELVPLVNNRKGSLLPPPRKRHLAQAEDGKRLQRAQSLPVKYRYHPSNATQRQCKELQTNTGLFLPVCWSIHCDLRHF